MQYLLQMSSSTFAWLLSPWSVLPRNKMAERFASVSEDELCEKCIIKQLLDEVENDIMDYQNRGLCYQRSVLCRSRRLRQITQTQGFDNS